MNNSALIWALHNIRHDRLLTVGQLGKAASKARIAAEVRESETMKSIALVKKTVARSTANNILLTPKN